MLVRPQALIVVILYAAAPRATGRSAAAPPTLPLRWSTLDPMPLPVFDAGARLSGGWIVVSGGFADDLSTVPVIQIHNDARGWRPIGTQLAEPRARHTQTMLSDGRVLVAGGVQGSLQPDAPAGPVALASAELFHPLVAGSELIDLGEALVGHTAHLLPDGRVAVVGGSWVRLFDPADDGFTEAIRLQRARHHHASVLWTRVVYPEPASPLLAGNEKEEPVFKIVAQELSIDQVPTARGASIGATLEPQKVVVPQIHEIPSLATRLVILIIGGDNDSTIEEVDLNAGRSRLWETQLPVALSDTGATAIDRERVLLIGGIDADSGRSMGATWWLDAHETVTAGPELDLPDGWASAACFIDLRDGCVVMLGGEQRTDDSLRPAPSGRMLLRNGRRVFSLPISQACVGYTRRAWFRLDDRQVVAVGGYRFVDAGAATADDPAGVSVRGVVDVVRMPTSLGGD